MSFEQRLKEVEDEKQREIKEIIEKQEWDMNLFKKACEELIKTKVGSYMYQTEKIKAIL